MIKKILTALLMLTLATGCAEQSKPETAESPVEEITFTRDDLCLYSEREEGLSYPIIWIGMDINSFDTENEYIGSFGDNDIAWRDAVTSEGEPTQCIKFINYSGGTRKGMETIKGIYSTGMYFNEDSPSSKGEDIITLYGLDPENELIYADKTDDSNYSIALYFEKGEDNTLTRLISTETRPLNTAEENVKYILKFLVTDGYVSNIQMIEK